MLQQVIYWSGSVSPHEEATHTARHVKPLTMCGSTVSLHCDASEMAAAKAEPVQKSAEYKTRMGEAKGMGARRSVEAREQQRKLPATYHQARSLQINRLKKGG